jgi:5'-deoxynucleotidase YfbR-like HD superfamily hydrolase
LLSARLLATLAAMQSESPHIHPVINFGQDLEKLRVPDPDLAWQGGQLEVPETVADRGFRAMHVAYILAHRCASALPERAAGLLLYSRLDLLTRRDDQDISSTEDTLRARIAPLGSAAQIVLQLRDELLSCDSLEARVAADSHLLAEAFSLLEQSAGGRTRIDIRLENISDNLHTEEARDLLKEASEVSPFRYWRDFSEAEPFSPSEVDYLYEVGKLRLQSRTGWEYIGIRHESVGAHSYRGAQLAPFLAHAYAEHHGVTVDPCLTAMHVAVHDVAEARGGDVNRVAKAYLTVREDHAIHHQTLRHGAAGRGINKMWRAVENKTPPEGLIAKDVDYTEMVIEAHSLVRRGIPAAIDWITNTKPYLETPLGIQIVETLNEEHSRAR